MKATVLYISKSGKSATIAVKQEYGKVNTPINGFVGINEGETLEVGEEIDLPNVTKVIVTVRNGEDGTPFNFLSFQ